MRPLMLKAIRCCNLQMIPTLKVTVVNTRNLSRKSIALDSQPMRPHPIDADSISTCLGNRETSRQGHGARARLR